MTNKSKNKIKDSKGYTVFRIFNTLFLLLVLFITAYPIYFVVIASISDPKQMISNYGLMWAPFQPLSLMSYEMVFKYPLVLTGFANTFFIVIVGVTLNMIMTFLGAYFLSLKGSMFRQPVAYLILFTMYFSGGLVPSYLNIKSLGMMNSLAALIIPGAINTYNMLIMRSAVASVPDSLVEAAKLDGASHFSILTKVIFPLTKATSAVLLLYYAVAHWNSWFSASLYISTPTKYPLQLILRQILILDEDTEIVNGMDAGTQMMASKMIKYSMIVISSLPILCLYPFLQKFFAKGVMVGALKG